MSLILTADAIQQQGGESVQFPGSNLLILDGSGIRSSNGASVLFNTPGMVSLTGVSGITSSENARIFPPPISGSTVSGNVSGYATRPGVPQDLIAVRESPSPSNPVSGTQINLSWTAPESDGRSTIFGYKIERFTTGSEWSTLVDDTGSAELTYSNISLAIGTTYKYRVSAINAMGTGDPSNEASASTWTVPDKVQTFTATAIPIPLAIRLQWSAVLTPADNGVSVTQYIIERFDDSKWAPYIYVNMPRESLSVDATIDIQQGVTYSFRIFAKNIVGTSTIASNTTTATALSAPSAPDGISATPSSPSQILQIHLQWSAPLSDTPLKGYTIQQSLDNTPNSWSTIVESTSSTSFTNTGLSEGTTYYYRVAAINDVGTGQWANISATTWTVPSEPSGLSATPVSSSQINLAWSAPLSTGGVGAVVTGYTVERSTDNFNWSLLDTVSGTSYNNTSLTEGTTYLYRVSAINDVGTRNPSTASAKTWTVPSAPTLIHTVQADVVSLSWSAPNNGGSALIGYRAEYRIDYGEWKGFANLGTSYLSTSYQTKSVGSTYSFRVFAINGVGETESNTITLLWQGGGGGGGGGK